MTKSVLLWVLCFGVASTANAQSFSGPYAGLEFGSQHVIGGSLVDGVDTLQQDTRLVVSAFAGLRLQVSRFVAGGELGIGRMDGDLILNDAARGVVVDYRNDSQWHWGLHAGFAAGARTLLFAYVSEVTRDFDVTITRNNSSTAQGDEQGLLRFGGGIEQRLYGPLQLRVTAGSSRADFGDRVTNIDIDRRIELAAGLVIQF
jgi:hypothetical protein